MSKRTAPEPSGKPDPVFREIAEIRDELGRQGGLLRTIVFAQAGIADQVMSAFEDDTVLARVFVELQIPQSQKQIVEKFAGEKSPGTSQSSISRKMERLEKELGVISPISSRGAEVLFGHSDSAGALRLMPAIKKHSSLRRLL